MKSNHSKHKQRGFFDLGLGIGLMIIFGGTAAVITPDNSRQYDMVDQNNKAVVQATKIVKKSKE